MLFRSIAVEGAAEDLSPGGAGQFLFGRLTLDFPNLAAFHANQPVSASNYRQVVMGFTGKISAPDRPEMRLVVSTTRIGVDAYSVTATYNYGTTSVTGTGTLDTANSYNSTLTLTNQDNVVITLQRRADINITKDGVLVGMIPVGSSIVYYTDGYFESF